MKRNTLLLCSLALCLTSQAEWFEVQSVSSYNQIVASRPNAPANTIKIRIKNLANIEDIQMNRSKVLLSGQSALELAEDVLQGQLVWIENLEEESGIHVGTIYLSYEQMIRGYAKQRMIGGQTVTPEVKEMVKDIYERMLRNLNTSTTFEDDALFLEAYNRAVGIKIASKNATIQSDSDGYFSYDTCYAHEYLKGIFAYEALAWFKEEGQFLPTNIQKMYLTWLSQYQGASDQRAKTLEMKIRDLTARHALYKDFLPGDETSCARGSFIPYIELKITTRLEKTIPTAQYLGESNPVPARPMPIRL